MSEDLRQFTGAPVLAGSGGLFGSPPQELCLAKAAICEEVVTSVRARFPGQVQSIILTGSLARLEATCVASQGASEIIGDAEFLLVFATRAGLPDCLQINSVRESIEAGLRRKAVHCHVSLGAVHPRYFPRLRPSVFTYELKSCGEVVWGDPGVLSQIPPFSPARIPREDGWRTLCNRLIEQLEAVEQAIADPSACAALRYRTVKLYLDMTTSLLVFLGVYEPSYLGRAQRLSSLVEDEPSAERLPFVLRPFAAKVAACTAFKLFGTVDCDLLPDRDDLTGVLRFWKESVGYARQLWRWELTQLVGVWEPFSDNVLMKKWMREQAVPDRIRGWLHVARKCGWRQGRKHWLRWARMGWHGSPRYCLYEAASQTCFRLPEVVGRAVGRSNLSFAWPSLHARIPLCEPLESNGQGTTWQKLVQVLVANYKDFLTDTRS